MSWCDKLASTPTIGLRFAMHHQSSDSILDALTPLLDSWVDGRKRQFNIETQESFAIRLVTDDGFYYLVDQERITVDFQHRWKVKPQSGGAPAAELTSKPLPFTELLPKVADRVTHVASLVNGSRSRVLDRIGIVSTTTVAEDEAPPGILSFIDFVSKPWKTVLEHFDIQITGNISKTADYYDRCIHHLTKAEDNPDKLLKIRLDWQRVFSSGKIITTDVLKRYISSAQESGLEYFEDVAEGGRFDG